MSSTVQIKLFATLKRLAPLNADRYPIEPGTTVQDVVEQIGIPINQAKLVFINNRKGTLSSMLSDGDRIGIFPPVGGG